jgi:heptosyltransferase-2
MNSARDRLLVRMPNWLGDIVLALRALAMVREARRGAHLAVALPASFAPLFHEGTNALPDEVIPLSGKGRGRAGDIARIRDAKPDIAILLTNSFGSAWVTRRARIPERWGYGANCRGPLLTRRVKRPRQRVHQAEYYAALMRGLGMPDFRGVPQIEPNARTLARARELLENAGVDSAAPLVGIAPGAAYGFAKRWPPRYVGEVARRLAQRGIATVLVGSGADRDAGREIESARTVNLIGRTSLTELVGVLASCGAVLSNDSGAMHLAAALGRPVVATFGPTDERVTAPEGAHDVLTADVFCRPCMLRDCPIDHRCMKRITVDRVTGALLKRLGQGDRT